MTAPRVFVSRATGLDPADQAVADRWAAALEGLGLEPVALERKEYRTPPWTQLRALVGSCQGLVVLGFRRTPTPWSQIEAGLGVMAGLPVLVAAEAGLSGGVFEPEAWGEGVRGAGLRAWEAPEPALQEWLAAVRTTAAAPTRPCPPGSVRGRGARRA